MEINKKSVRKLYSKNLEWAKSELETEEETQSVKQLAVKFTMNDMASITKRYLLEKEKVKFF
tara:strand:+ start:2310 stop:2495 length:186 start_codon:yes stop_codon:yes gene_type:complete